MPVETDQERAAMVHSSEFGVVARFFPQAGGSFTADVIKDEPYLRSEMDLAAVSSRVPSITTLESWVTSIDRNDEVEVPDGGKRYRIEELHPRQGLIVLTLDEA